MRQLQRHRKAKEKEKRNKETKITKLNRHKATEIKGKQTHQK